ncbi:O-antigen ligase family protein [Pandoraea sp. NPDC087047]|uniref:O-antigen ligase family protein n=1 Tax=Pandoraea sp. NPDC087047 TaxID=3364390 RepID=UPI0037FA1374
MHPLQRLNNRLAHFVRLHVFVKDSVPLSASVPLARWNAALLAFVVFASLFGQIVPAPLVTNPDLLARAMRVLSSYVTPLIFAFLVVSRFIAHPKPAKENRLVFGAALALTVSYFFSILISATHGEVAKSAAIAVFFSLATVVLFDVFGSAPQTVARYLRILCPLLVAWTVIPAVLSLAGPLRPLFMAIEDSSMHGFAESRIGFVLWGSMGLFLLWCSGLRARHQYVHDVLMGIMLIALYFAQSRGVVVGLSAAVIYYRIQSDEPWRRKMRDIAIVVVVAALVCLSWKVFGRQEPLEMVNGQRSSIYSSYFHELKRHSALFGAGTMVDIPLEGTTQRTQAHNLVLQWLANWGILGAIGICVFLYATWTRLKTVEARMLLLIFMTYSMTQPVQGTPNFFAPITLLWYFTIIAVDVRSRVRAQAVTESVPARQATTPAMPGRATPSFVERPPSPVMVRSANTSRQEEEPLQTYSDSR